MELIGGAVCFIMGFITHRFKSMEPEKRKEERFVFILVFLGLAATAWNAFSFKLP